MRAALLLLVCTVGWAGAVGCAGAVGAPSTVTVEQEDPEEILRAGRAALDEAGLDRLVWALTPYLITDTMEARYRPVFDHVEGRLGVAIDVVVGTTYADMEQRVVSGSVDLGVLPPYAYVQGQAREPGMTVFASHVAEGSPTYACYVIVQDGDRAGSLRDLRGRTLAFVDKKSTSGWLVPAARLLEEGLDPLEDVRPVFLGSHDAVFDAVADGRASAGAIYGGALTGARKRRPNAPAVRVLAKGARMPNDAYVARPGFPPAAARALAQALSEISTRTATGRRILGVDGAINGFMAVDDSHYDVVRAVERTVLTRTGGAAPPTP